MVAQNGTHVIANNSTKNNLVFFFVSYLKIVFSNNSTWSQCLVQERKNILRYHLFGDKIIQNCLKINATH